MNRILLLLLVAGLVTGVALVSMDFSETNNAVLDQERIDRKDQNETDQPLSARSETDQENQNEKEGASSDSEVPVESDVETLDLKVDYVSSDTDITTRYRVRNPGTDEEDLRYDATRKDGSRMVLILRQGEDEGWFKDYSSGAWAHLTGPAFSQIWRKRSDQYLLYQVEGWKEMEGEESTVETEDGTATVYDVRVNEGLASSVFEPE